MLLYVSFVFMKLKWCLLICSIIYIFENKLCQGGRGNRLTVIVTRVMRDLWVDTLVKVLKNPDPPSPTQIVCG